MIRWKWAFGIFALLVLGTEAGLRLFEPSWLAQPRGIPLVSLPLEQARLQALQKDGRGRKTLLFLGDSVAWGSALHEHGLPGWREKTPGAFLAASLPASWRCVEFSADGLYAPDLESLLAMGMSLKPDAVVVELNYRMFASEAGEPSKAFSRPWLDPQAPKLSFNERAEDALRRHAATFRDAELATALLFEPSLGQALAKAVDGLFPADDNADARDALLDLKLKPYYASPQQDPRHAGFQALRRMALLLKGMRGPSLIFLTPQNTDRVAEYLDKKGYAGNRGLLKAAGGASYRDWSGRKVQGAFLDHCHLDEAGNRWLAGQILEGLKL